MWRQQELLPVPLRCPRRHTCHRGNLPAYFSASQVPPDHPARQASPHATMEILRKHLDSTCSTAVREIQQVPSGLAIRPKDDLGLHLLTERRETLIQGAKAEIEQTWAIFVIPNAPLDLQVVRQDDRYGSRLLDGSCAGTDGCGD